MKYLTLAFLTGCAGVPVDSLDAGTPPNAIECACELQIPSVYAPGCVLAGGSDHDGYCYAGRAESICYYPTDGAGADAYCATAALTIVSTLFLLSGGCRPGQVCPVGGFCGNTVARCHAVQTWHAQSCDAACPAVALTLDSQGTPNNLTSATYVPANLACGGVDTEKVCGVGR